VAHTGSIRVMALLLRFAGAIVRSFAGEVNPLADARRCYAAPCREREVAMKRCENPACPDRETLGLAGEYVDGIVTCPRCGGPLTPAVEGAPDATAPPNDEEFALAG